MDDYLAEVTRMLNIVGLSGTDPRHQAFLNKIGEICNQETLEGLIDLKNSMAIYADPSYEPGINPVADMLVEKAEDYDITFLRGLLAGIIYCLAMEHTFTPAFSMKPHHDRVIPMFEATRQYILERASSI